MKETEEKGRHKASDVIESMIEEFRAHLVIWEEEYKKKLREKEMSLIEAERLASVGRLAGGVAHEINNPLTNILTSADYVLKRIKKDDPLREDLEIIVNETIRCREIVKGLLDFSRQSRPEKRLTDVNKIIGEAVHLVKNKVLFQNISIIRELAGLPEVAIDAGQMEQVFLNLLLNAAEAMPSGGRLLIQSREKDGFIELKFQDTGCGIKEGDLGRIFEPFFTTKSQDKTSDLDSPFSRIAVGGMGLGLSVTKGIIEHHGGKIYVESEIGKGTTFTILLHVSQREGSK